MAKETGFSNHVGMLLLLLKAIPGDADGACFFACNLMVPHLRTKVESSAKK
jgi:hypothetical protein